MAAIEEAEELSPFFESGFAATRALQAAFAVTWRKPPRRRRAPSRRQPRSQSGMVSAALDLLRGQLAFFRGEWPTAAKLALASTENTNFVLEGAHLGSLCGGCGRPAR